MVVGNLGFRAFVVLVLVAIGLFIRRKWRLAEARREEIRLLLAMASEEAARAEFEASIEYAASSPAVAVKAAPSPATQRYCAVCYSPTTSRCRRCKSVRYCSSKCQVIHWRQGHKDECSPSLSNLDANDEGRKLASESAEQDHHGDEFTSKSAEEESEYESDSFVVLAQNSPRKENIGSDPVRDQNTLLPENCSVSATSAVSHEKIDGNSVLKDGELQEANASNNVLPGMSLPVMSNIKEESQCISTSASDSDENIVPEPSATSSGFWDGYLESSIITNKISQSSGLKTNHVGLIDRNALDSRSLHRSSLDFSGESSSDLHLKGPALSNHTFAERRQTPIKVANLSEKEAANSFSSSGSVLLKSEQPISIKKGASVGSNGMKPSLVNATITESPRPSMSKIVTPQKVSRSRSVSDANNHSSSGFKPIQADNDNRNGVHYQAQNILRTSRVKVNQPKPSKLSKHYSFGVGSGSSAQNNEKGLFSYELFVKLYNWKEVELRPCGLINCGNSCYANAVLQCLTFTPPLTAYLLQSLHSEKCAKRDWCFTCEFERLILSVKKGGAPLSPIRILSHIEKIGSLLANGREEDAHEFMRYAIDTMQSICLQEAGVSGAKSLEEETTLLGLTFGGYLRSKIRCMRCRGKSEQHERMMDLTVEIGGNIETLEEALRKFTGAEILDGDNKYQCSRCKSYEKAKKRLTIYEAPNVLTIALKRFQAGKFGKLNKSIRFPDVLDLAPYMRGSSDKSPIYRLYGVIVHLDVMNATFSGHYICYVRNAQNKWFKIDDSMVKAVEMDSVLKEGAYMLFYSRYSPRAPRSIRDSVVSRDILNKGKPPEAKSSKFVNEKKGLKLVGGQSMHSNQIPPTSPNFITRVQEAETSSESCSLFSNSEEGASTTDSNQESSTTSTDELLDHFFGEGMINNHFRNWRSPLDSDTSSSSSTSSSPLYMARPSPLSNTERYASEVSVLQSDNMKNCSKLVNSSSSSSSNSRCREGAVPGN